MLRVFYCLILLISFCKTEKPKKEYYILIIKEINILENASLDARIITTCPKGEILKIINEHTIRHPTKDQNETFYEVYFKNLKGYIYNDIDYDTFHTYSIYYDDDYNFLLNNKNYLYSIKNYKKELIGEYQSGKLFINIFGNFDGLDVPQTTNIMLNHLYPEVLYVEEIEKNYFKVYNNENEVYIRKANSDEIIIHVIKGDEYFKPFHDKKLKKYIRRPLLYPLPQKNLNQNNKANKFPK